MKRSRVTIYKAKDGWRWRLQAKNGKIVAEGGEAYTRKSIVGKSIRRAFYSMCIADWPPESLK